MLSLKLSSATVFEEPELLAVGKETIDGWFAESEEDENCTGDFFMSCSGQQDHVALQRDGGSADRRQRYV